MKSDIEISQETKIEPIINIANKLNFNEEDLELYGRFKAKISYEAIEKVKKNENGKLILVTAINPTPAGEGKSTVSIGLADALNRLGKQAVLALREPSLGPVMGVKGGATGGGYSQVVPMEDINLHFTGDMHAITTANNALSALLDNHIQQGNELAIDTRRVLWKRVVDLNDRALRHIVIGLGGAFQGVPREDGFDITVASEIMAILCLANSIKDLKERLSKIVIGFTTEQKPVTVKDLKVEGALTLLLKDALKPNLVQTLSGTPAFVHGGPFANIAHGCNSVMATNLALKTGEYIVTEAGFGADLGAEKFLDIKAPAINKTPDAIVIVATIRALKMHGGTEKTDLLNENIETLKIGYANLRRHVQNMRKYNIPVVVAINEFSTDTNLEIGTLYDLCKEDNVQVKRCAVWEKGGQGGEELAKAVMKEIEMTSETQQFNKLYEVNDSIENKITSIVHSIYGGRSVIFTNKARNQIASYEKLGWDKLPICMAKTQYSFSDDPSKLGAPNDFDITIREFVPKLGAGFIVALTGDVLTMPGLPKNPAALKMDVTDSGDAVGLF